MFIKFNKGFSLLEMTVVLIIITTVASAVIPQMIKGYVINAANKVALDISAIEEASRAYYVANNSWPDSMAALQAGNFLPSTWNGINPFGFSSASPSAYSYNISSGASLLTVSTTVPIAAQPTIQSLLPLTSVSGTMISSTVSIPGSASSLPSGSIIMWAGSIASIPSGWVLCNGSNGTPNLTDRFVIAAGNSYSPGQTGNGSLPATSAIVTSALGAQWADVNYSGPGPYIYTHGQAKGLTQFDTLSVSFGSGSQNIAVYYALAYIMKI